MTTPLIPRETRRAASLKGWRTRKRMAEAREARDAEGASVYFEEVNAKAERDRLLWPSSYDPSEE